MTCCDCGLLADHMDFLEELGSVEAPDANGKRMPASDDTAEAPIESITR